MKLTIKYLKPFTLTLSICIALLFMQALTDLSLPNLMSDIVNIGIQQSGINETAPKVVSENGYKLITLFMTEENKELMDAGYKRIFSGTAEAEEYVAEYPLLEHENIYILDTDDDFEIECIGNAYGKAGLSFLSYMKEFSAEQYDAAQSNAGQDKNDVSIIADVDITALYEILPMLSQLPVGTFDEAIARAERSDSSLYRQVGIGFTKLFYTEIGIDMHKLQNSYILNTGVLMLLVTLIGAAAAVGVGFFSSRIGAGVSKRLRRDVFRKVESFSLEDFDKFSASTLITRTTNDVTQIQMLIIMGIRMMVFAPIMGIGGIIMALEKSASLSWIIAVAVFVLIGVISVIFTIAVPKFKQMQKFVDRMNLVTREFLSGMMVIRAFSNQRYEEKRFEKASRDLKDTNRFVTRVVSFMWPCMMLIMNLTSLLIIWVGARQIEQATMQVGDMMAFIQYGMQIIMSFLMISVMFIMLPRAAVSASRISEVLSTEPAIKDNDNPKSFGKKCKGEIVFNNVYFKYNGAEDYVLKNISFIAKPGETTAIIGSTGSGKSTLVNLIPRFYEVTQGEITVDGINIKHLSQYELRENIGFVPQRLVLFSGNIDSNIRYGKEDITEEKILLASEIAQIKEFIDSLENGLQTDIAQGGGNVSGGQKQRLSIARALVKNAPIYIFDDSFSALDFKTDAALRKSLKKYIGSSTVLIVAQRISTIMNAEQIIVLDEGKIAGIGKHKDLLRTCRAYREIAESQLPEEELR